jgi:hypothetical protein
VPLSQARIQKHLMRNTAHTYTMGCFVTDFLRHDPMIEHIKPVESRSVADLMANAVWQLRTAMGWARHL